MNEMNRRTWLTAIMAMPFLWWLKPKPKLPAGIIARKPYYVVGVTHSRFGIVTHKDDGNFIAVTSLKVGQPVYFK